MEFKKKQISNSCIRNTVFFIVTILVTLFKNQLINFFTSEGFLSREYYFRLSLSIYKDENFINSYLLLLIAFFVVSIFIFNYFMKSMNTLQRLSRLKKSYQRMLGTKKESEVRTEKLDQEAVKEEHNDTKISIHESIIRVDESTKEVRIVDKLFKYMGLVFIILLFGCYMNILIKSSILGKYRRFQRDLIILETKIPEIEIKKLKVEWIEIRSKYDYLEILYKIDGYLNIEKK